MNTFYPNGILGKFLPVFLILCLINSVFSQPTSIVKAKFSFAFNNVIEKISYGFDGSQGNGNSFLTPSVSDDGRYIVFRSDASNIVANDTNHAWDVFVHDRLTGTNQRISESVNGQEGNLNSTHPSISGNGQYVTFVSSSTNFVPGSYWGISHIYLKNLQTGKIHYVSHSYNGTPTNGSSYNPSISFDGRYVVFWSSASNLVSSDTNSCPLEWSQNCTDIFLFDRVSNLISRVSVSSSGAQTEDNKASFMPKISPNGRYVAFGSTASNLVTGDTNGVNDLFIRDLETLITYRIASSGGFGDFSPDFSFDGRYIAFYSISNTIVTNDTNGREDVFVYDQQTDSYSRVSVDSNGNQGNGHSTSSVSISSDGRYIAFRSDATNLVPNDNNAYIVCDQYEIGAPANCPDVFLHDTQTGKTTLLSVALDGTQANHYTFGVDISGDATTVAFESFANNLVPNDTNNAGDIFVKGLVPLKVTSITRTTSALTNASTISFNVAFSNDATNVDISDFVVTSNGSISGAVVTDVNGGGVNYNITVNTGSGDGTLRLDVIDDDTIIDSSLEPLGGFGAGNGNFTNGEVYTIDKTPPTVSSITRVGTSPSNMLNVSYLVTFSESVTGVDINDFNINTSGLTGGFVSNVSGSGNTRVVSMNTGQGDGSIQLNFIDNDSVTDLASNLITSGLNGETYIIDKPQLFAPILRSPRSGGAVNDTTPNFIWQRVTNAQDYEIQIDNNTDFLSLEDSGVTTSTTYTPLSALPDGTYYWRVRANDVSNAPGKWSQVRTITIDTTGPAAPTLISPSGTTSTRTITFRWSAVSDATGYQFAYDNDANCLSPISTVTLRGISRRMTLPSGNYYWCVRAKDSVGNWGLWSIPNAITVP